MSFVGSPRIAMGFETTDKPMFHAAESISLQSEQIHSWCGVCVRTYNANLLFRFVTCPDCVRAMNEYATSL